MGAGSLRARAGWPADTPMPCTHAVDQARAGRDRRVQCKDDRLPGRGRRRGLQRQDDRIGVGLRLTLVATSEKAIASMKGMLALLPGARTRTPVPKLTTLSRFTGILKRPQIPLGEAALEGMST